MATRRQRLLVVVFKVYKLFRKIIFHFKSDLFNFHPEIHNYVKYFLSFIPFKNCLRNLGWLARQATIGDNRVRPSKSLNSCPASLFQVSFFAFCGILIFLFQQRGSYVSIKIRKKPKRALLLSSELLREYQMLPSWPPSFRQCKKTKFIQVTSVYGFTKAVCA